MPQGKSFYMHEREVNRTTNFGLLAAGVRGYFLCTRSDGVLVN